MKLHTKIQKLQNILNFFFVVYINMYMSCTYIALVVGI